MNEETEDGEVVEDLPKRKITCIYHAHCIDGFTAAWVLDQFVNAPYFIRRRIHDVDCEVEYLPFNYGETHPLHKYKDKHVVILDFSFKRDVMEDLIKYTKSLLVLDHHKTAKAELKGLEVRHANELFGKDSDVLLNSWLDCLVDEKERQNFIVYDMKRSGAGLAWDFFFSGLKRTELIDYVEDRDLWIKDYEHTDRVHAYLASIDHDFDKWTEAYAALDQHSMRRPYDFSHWTFEREVEILNGGEAILRDFDKQVQAIVDRSWIDDGFDVVHNGKYFEGIPVVNCDYHYASEVGNRLSKDQPFSATYVDKGKDRQYSLRSAPDGMDVGEIAKYFGGGGHKHAAGFIVKDYLLDNPDVFDACGQVNWDGAISDAWRRSPEGKAEVKQMEEEEKEWRKSMERTSDG